MYVCMHVCIYLSTVIRTQPPHSARRKFNVFMYIPCCPLTMPPLGQTRASPQRETLAGVTAPNEGGQDSQQNHLETQNTNLKSGPRMPQGCAA